MAGSDGEFEDEEIDHELEAKHAAEDAHDARNHKPVYVNKRWVRETDMRQIIRHLADHGEKMVQKERSRDYKEEFEEYDSSLSDIYVLDSDEELNELKQRETERRQLKSKKETVKAQAGGVKRQKGDNRACLFKEGEAIVKVSAFDPPTKDEL